MDHGMDLEVLSLFLSRSSEYILEIIGESRHLPPPALRYHHFIDSAVNRNLKVLSGDLLCEHTLLVLFHRNRCENFKGMNKSNDHLGRLIHCLQDISI